MSRRLRLCAPWHGLALREFDRREFDRREFARREFDRREFARPELSRGVLAERKGVGGDAGDG